MPHGSVLAGTPCRDTQRNRACQVLREAGAAEAPCAVDMRHTASRVCWAAGDSGASASSTSRVRCGDAVTCRRSSVSRKKAAACGVELWRTMARRTCPSGHVTLAPGSALRRKVSTSARPAATAPSAQAACTRLPEGPARSQWGVRFSSVVPCVAMCWARWVQAWPAKQDPFTTRQPCALEGVHFSSHVLNPHHLAAAPLPESSVIIRSAAASPALAVDTRG